MVRRAEPPPAEPPPPFDRAAMLGRLEREEFDVVVVGGGITGVGVALDAATRGLRTALVERDDFAAGTSSRSSKLVHGGLRYLQQGDVALVREALRERHRLHRNARHLVHVMPFMIPILAKAGADEPRSVVSRKIARALGSAMWMYDVAGGWRIGRVHRRLRRSTAAAHLPTMARERLVGAYLYFDAAADDARLVVAIARTAASHGAVLANRAPVVELLHRDDGSADGVVVEADGHRIRVRARVVVNATGVWADDVRALDEGTHPETIRPAKGVHVTVPWSKVRNDLAVVIPVPKDRRSLFLVPWGERPDGTFDHTYIGTTDTDHDGPLDEPVCTHADLEYVLRAVNASITTGITVDDVTGTWAGLRPLVREVPAPSNPSSPSTPSRTADLSRRHRVTTSASGVITVTGGKLTTYREMAEDTIDVAVERLGVAHLRCRTRRLAVVGNPRRAGAAARLGAALRRARTGRAGRRRDARTRVLAQSDLHLHRRYGTEAAVVRALVDADASLGDPLVPGLAYLRAEAVHAARHEMATTLDDVLSRRTRARLLDRAATAAAAPDVARLLAAELGWSDAEVQRQIDDVRSRCAAEDAAMRTPARGEQVPVTHADQPDVVPAVAVEGER